MSHLKTIFIIVLFNSFALTSNGQTYLDSTASIDDRVSDLLSKMTLEEKIGQMMQVDHTNLTNNPEDITTYKIGSVLSGGDAENGNNLTATWADLYDNFQSKALNNRLKIPIIYGIDAVHGNNNIYGATIFPHNIGLGCTRNSELVESAGRVTAAEVAATGIDWTFAPCIAVPRDERWGRTYEGFGEDPVLAESLGSAQVRGLQGYSLSSKTSILACTKHYLADGGTLNGRDQGNFSGDESLLRSIHLPGYIAAVNIGVGSIMVSFSSINEQKMHGNKYWLTDVLKREMGFKGFVVSDWAGVDQLNSNYKNAVEIAINAGIDMVMLPHRYKEFLSVMLALVYENKISLSRIDDAVSRILYKKFELGLFERPYADRSLIAKVRGFEHRSVARQAVRESIVLLKKKDNILPLPKTNVKIHIAGSHADNMGYQCGGWTIAWQGRSGDITPGTTILEAIKKAAPTAEIEFSESGDFTNDADYSIAIIGETPYAEGIGDNSDLNISREDADLVRKLKSTGKPLIVILISGRPLIIEKILHYSDVIFAAWLPGTEGEGVADILFGDHQPKGLLSHSWPANMSQIPINNGDADYEPLYEYGYGISSLDNSPAGSAPVIQSAIVTEDGKHIELSFNKEMADPSGTSFQFIISKNNTPLNANITLSLKSSDKTIIILSMDSSITKKDSIYLEYLQGEIRSYDNGLTKYFGISAYNFTKGHVFTIPSRIEAEDYNDMNDVLVEITNDIDGTSNLIIKDGSWLEYLVNVEKLNNYMLSLRISSESESGTITLTSGSRKIVTRTLPVTGNWDTWTTVKQLIALAPGEQIIRLTADKGGFKINWLAIDKISTSVDDNPIQLRNNLEQNYPNPFNPSTEIKYSVKESGRVSLRIYDILGKQIAILFEGHRAAGDYSVCFDIYRSHISSGVYFYVLEGTGFRITKKMLLLR